MASSALMSGFASSGGGANVNPIVSLLSDDSNRSSGCFDGQEGESVRQSGAGRGPWVGPLYGLPFSPLPRATRSPTKPPMRQ
jgi:hypothetical protein